MDIKIEKKRMYARYIEIRKDHTKMLDEIINKKYK